MPAESTDDSVTHACSARACWPVLGNSTWKKLEALAAPNTNAAPLHGASIRNVALAENVVNARCV